MCFCKISKNCDQTTCKKTCQSARARKTAGIYFQNRYHFFFSSEIAHLFISDILYWP